MVNNILAPSTVYKKVREEEIQINVKLARNLKFNQAGAPKSLMTNCPLLTIVSRLVKCADVPVQCAHLKMVFLLHRLHVPYFPSACVA